MKVVRDSGECKTVKFEDLDDGEAYIDEGQGGGQIKIKTDEESGCCLESGVLGKYDSDENNEVVRVKCEVRVS